MNTIPQRISGDAAIVQKIKDRGYDGLAKLGEKALAAVSANSFYPQAGKISPALGKEILAALAPLAEGTEAAPESAKLLDSNDAMSVVLAFVKGPVSFVSFTPAQFDAFSKQLLQFVADGNTSTAAMAFKNFDSSHNKGAVQFPDWGLSYAGDNAVSNLTYEFRDALRAKGVDPDSMGIPQPGPQAM